MSLNTTVSSVVESALVGGMITGEVMWMRERIRRKLAKVKEE
jgi:hypothetical protein